MAGNVYNCVARRFVLESNAFHDTPLFGLLELCNTPTQAHARDQNYNNNLKSEAFQWVINISICSINRYSAEEANLCQVFLYYDQKQKPSNIDRNGAIASISIEYSERTFKRDRGTKNVWSRDARYFGVLPEWIIQYCENLKQPAWSMWMYNQLYIYHCHNQLWYVCYLPLIFATSIATTSSFFLLLLLLFFAIIVFVIQC